jgi:catechol 2,3-dioxygenase-like lactoylglutathione lyase family enzyme
MASKAPLVEGVHHLALVTSDMDATMRFWHEVLRAEIVATMSTDDYRAYFFRIGESQTVAFIEYHGVDHERYIRPAPVEFALAPQFDHLSLNLDDEQSVLALRARLIEYGCEVSEVVDRGILCSISFTDPSGVALEASWWTIDLDANTFDDSARFQDPDPVPALVELRATGRIAAVPSRPTVDGIVREPRPSLSH